MNYKIYSRPEIDNPDFKLQPGSFILTHGNSLIDRMIRLFTLSRWNHAALVVDENGTIIELEAGGIKLVNIDKYPANEFQLIDLEMSDEDRKQVVNYAGFMLNKHSKYGFLRILTIFFKIITKSRLVVKLDGVKSWGPKVVGGLVTNLYDHDVYVRSYNAVLTYAEDRIRHFVYDKELSEEDMEYQLQ